MLALEEHAQRLFMLVLASDLPSGLGEADVINGLALLSVLINASYGGWVGLLPAGCTSLLHSRPLGAHNPPVASSIALWSKARRQRSLHLTFE